MLVPSRVIQVLAGVGCLFGFGASALAQSDVHVYMCIDSFGQKTYTNTRTSRACKRLDLHPVISVPAPQRRSSPSSSASSSSARSSYGSVSVRPANFPRIDTATQRARDSDRRQILEDELQFEQEKLTELDAEYGKTSGQSSRGLEIKEDIQRTKANIDSLKNELAAMRQ